jgi:pyruvate formate lyase activating enzyme
MEYYRPIENGKIECLLCRHHCKLREGQTGICGVNRNENGKLKNLVYGKPVSINIDPVEKKPLYHFLPGTQTLSLGTIGCNFKCPFCQNWEISQSREVDTPHTISPEKIVEMALRYNCRSIAYTYNEPSIFYPYARDIGVKAREKGLKNIFVTNGFESQYEIEDMKGWVDGVNIDLKSFNPNYYRKVLKGKLEGVLDTIRRLKEGGVWVEVTTLIVPEGNDSPEELREIARFIASVSPSIPWHISRFRPDYKEREKEPTPISKMVEAYQIGKEEGLYYIYLGNVTLPAITYCPKCGKELIVRYLFGVEKDLVTQTGGRCPQCGREIEGVWK